MEWLTEFPDLGTSTLRNIRLTVDGAFREFTRAYGESIELLFEPVKWFLINSENFMTDMPWPLILGIVAFLVWLASRSWKITLSSVVVLIVIGLFSRLAALGMIGFIAVQTFVDITVHQIGAEAIGGWFDRFPDSVIADQRLLWIVPLSVIILKGPGLLSVDALLSRFKPATYRA